MQAADGSWQSATSATGRVLEVPLGVQAVKIAPIEPFQPQPDHSVKATFGNQLALVGYDLNATTGEITLYWQALGSMQHDYTTFVHVLAADGTLITQADGQPQNGRYPTSIWEAGEFVADPKALPFVADGATPAQIAIGVYALETQQRLPVFDDAGEQLPNDQLLLSNLFK